MFVFSLAVSLLLSFLCDVRPVVGLVDAVRDSSLFNLDSLVVELKDDNFTRIHPVAPLCPWVVLFYNHGCGFCRSYSPTYSSFATGLREEHGEDPLQMATAAAVDCAEEVEFCKRYDIKFVPRTYFFYPKGECKSIRECGALPLEHVAFEEAHMDAHDLLLETNLLINKYMQFNSTLKERCMDMHFKLYASKEEMIKKHLSSSPSKAAEVFVETTELHVSDIAGAFFSTMHNEVPLFGFVPSEQLSALKDFLLLVRDVLPTLRADAVLNALESLKKGDSFSVVEWQKMVVDAAIPFEGTARNVQWRTCRGSAVHYRGFPCGMWLLYHTLTVNAPAERKPLKVIQNYVRYFFSCENCRDHFLQFQFNPDGDAVIQLWRAHNEVNARLANVVEGADPLVPKRQFPPRDMCPDCYEPAGSFNTAKVVAFMKQRYLWRRGVSLSTKPAHGNAGAVGLDNGGANENVKRDKMKEDVNAKWSTRKPHGRDANKSGGSYTFLFFNMFIVGMVFFLGSADILRKIARAKEK
uniref:Sulfhydryl oxidase n=1 Tax=Trypanosoma congolense (strain IL3000) TaxID=1068625 RepID=G0UNF2_TRYCI|nr:unnamed protein product [Trypanosoma congolense IL3000]